MHRGRAKPLDPFPFLYPVPYVVFYGTSGGIVGRLLAEERRNGEISGNNIIWRGRGDGEDRGSWAWARDMRRDSRRPDGTSRSFVPARCAACSSLVAVAAPKPAKREGEKSNPGDVIISPPPALQPPPSRFQFLLLRFENFSKLFKNEFARDRNKASSRVHYSQKDSKKEFFSFFLFNQERKMD